MESKPITKLPGFGKPLRDQKKIETKRRFPNAINEQSESGSYEANLLPMREYTIMEMVNVMTDKPDWQRKAFDDAIVAKWREELLSNNATNNASNDRDGSNSGDDPDREDEESTASLQNDEQTNTNQPSVEMSDSGSGAWSVGSRQADVSEKMVDWAIAEVRYKAELLQKCDCIEALDGVWKSDTIVSEDLKTELKSAAAGFEDVPEKDKDWHPGSNEQVLDLVHPSIYPLVYGQSKIIESGECGVDDCLSWIGKGETIPETQVGDDTPRLHTVWWSKDFQWLPSEFDVPVDSEEVQVKSYINNVHPKHQPELYTVIPKIVAKSIPLWNRVLSCLDFAPCVPPRVSDWSNGDGLGYDPREVEPDQNEGEDDDDYYERLDDWRQARTIIEPEPPAFMTPKQRLLTPQKRRWSEGLTDPVEQDPPDLSPEIDLRRDFGRLQIIVKLANIHLTPEKSRYSGGTWHVEGQGNEAICATALYYYDSENITDSRLSFRQQVEDGMELPYEQNEHTAVQQIYGFENEDPTIQNLGSVNTREGRLLCFPNVMQHRVSPFELKDPTKPGHRKILALFLVDPHCKIISTANIPPQQHSWWKEVVESAGVMDRMPTELWQNVLDLSDYPVSLEKAKEQREQLMNERRRFVSSYNDSYTTLNTFNLCEH